MQNVDRKELAWQVGTILYLWLVEKAILGGKLFMCFREKELDYEYGSSEHLFMHSGTPPLLMKRPYECISYRPPAKNNPETGQVIWWQLNLFFSALSVLDQKKTIVLKCPITENNQFSDFLQIEHRTHIKLEGTRHEQDSGNHGYLFLH